MVHISDDIGSCQRTPPSSSIGRDSPMLPSPVNPLHLPFSDEVFSALVEMGFPGYLVFKAMKEARPKAEISDLIDTISNYPKNDEACCSKSWIYNHFLAMGFNEEKIVKIVNKLGDDNLEAIANELLSCEDEIEKLPKENEDDMVIDLPSDEKDPIQTLVSMGFSVEDASFAVQRCGEDMCMAELTDKIYAAQLAREFDQFLDESEQPKPRQVNKKRQLQPGSKRKRSSSYDDEPVRLPNPMIGFGLPNGARETSRRLPEKAQAPPYFYYENVAYAPMGVWRTISRRLYGTEPEFFDSKHICATARKRGYIHNLPIDSRFLADPPPRTTISEALPHTEYWRPHWDIRTKFNCITTSGATGLATGNVFNALLPYTQEYQPPADVRREVLKTCREHNLVWVGRNRVAPLEAKEIEILLGFPENHTQGMNSTDRHKSLGNSFQVDTVAYHLSVLKSLFPTGLNVLSLFTGIGGAEVALHRLGIRMKTVVSVEISEVNRNILKTFWVESNQRGKLIEYADVKALTNKEIEELMDEHGGFDLVIGGCRSGLQGASSSLFLEYCRILEAVRAKTRRMRRSRV